MTSSSAQLDRVGTVIAEPSADQRAQAYADRRRSERIAHLRKTYDRAMRVAESNFLSVQRRYDASRDALVALYSLSAFDALHEQTIEDGVALCKEYYALLHFKQDFNNDIEAVDR